MLFALAALTDRLTAREREKVTVVAGGGGRAGVAGRRGRPPANAAASHPQVVVGSSSLFGTRTQMRLRGWFFVFARNMGRIYPGGVGEAI